MNESFPQDISNLQLEIADSGTGNTISVTGAFLLAQREVLEANRIPFFRVRRRADGKLGVEPSNFAAIEQLADSDRLRKQFVIHKNWQKQVVVEALPLGDDPFSHKLAQYVSLGSEERAEEASLIRSTIEGLRRSNIAPMKKAEAIMSAVEETFLLNKASLQLNKAEITQADRTIASETQAMVNAAISIVEESELTAYLFECFKSMSNGQTINHITRVFSMFSGFLHYYNRLQNQRLSQNLRLIFQNEYLESYRHILPGLQAHLFTSDNMVQLPRIDPPELKKYALGAFLHDIGKMADLDYFESNAGYDSKKIRDHVFVSSGLILMNYGTDHEEARIMAGDHHNALGHKDGYSVSRWERERSIRKLAETVRCISSSADEYGSGIALGFLPVEMLSIVDIYDAMTDNSRTYKKGMSPSEAISFMAAHSLAAGKIDPVLYDLFIDFLKHSGIDLPAEQGFFFKFRNRKSPS